MTKANMDLSELLAKQYGSDFLCAVSGSVLQLIMEADVYGLIGAGCHERSGERTTIGYPDRTFDTRLGTLNLRVSKLRQATRLSQLVCAADTRQDGQLSGRV